MMRIIIEHFSKKKLTTSPERQREKRKKKLNWNYEITEEKNRVWGKKKEKKLNVIYTSTLLRNIIKKKDVSCPEE